MTFLTIYLVLSLYALWIVIDSKVFDCVAITLACMFFYILPPLLGREILEYTILLVTGQFRGAKSRSVF